MLPDFPFLKNEVEKIALAGLRQYIDKSDPVLSQIKHHTQQEGIEMRYEQVGVGSVQEGFEQIGTTFEITLSEVPDLVGDKFNAQLTAIGDKIIPLQAKAFFQKVGDSCNKVGTSVDAGGKPISAEMVLEMIDGVQMEFGADGKPQQSFVIHPDMLPALKKVADQLENDSNLKKKHAEILARQRESWVARESNRKLVD